MTTITTFVLPVTNIPQEFTTELVNTTYTITCKFNDQPDAGWVLDISDINDLPICCNIPLVTGIDLLFGLEYLGIGGSLYVSTDGASPDDVPTLDNLGTDSNLYFQTVVSS